MVAGHFVVVVGVEGLAKFEHDVVCGVDHVIDGPDAVAAETVADPLGRRADFHIFQQASAEAAAVRRIVDGDGPPPFKGRAVFHDFHFGESDFPLEDGPHFLREADHAEAVRAVCGEFKFENDVVEAEEAGEVHAHGGIRRKDHDAFLVRAGEEHGIEAELGSGAHHARGFHAAEFGFLDFHFADLIAAGGGGVVLRGDARAVEGDGDDLAGHARFDIRRAGDDLHGRFLPHVELTYDEMIRVGMFFHGEKPSGDDAGDAFAGVHHVFDRDAVVGERLRHLLRVEAADVYKGIEPFQRSIHL